MSSAWDALLGIVGDPRAEREPDSPARDWYEEGDPCRLTPGCAGSLCVAQEPCYCAATHAPCSHCTSAWLECSQCGEMPEGQEPA